MIERARGHAHPFSRLLRGYDMKLYELLNGVAVTSLPDIEINGLFSDSRKEMGEGSLFVCLKGKNFDAHDSIPELAKKGVAAFVVEHDCGIENQIIVPDAREALALLWANFCGNPQRRMKMIAVTGTNGKTTITTVIKKLLTSLGHKVGLIGTCANEIGDEVFPAERSTPEPAEFYPLLQKMADAGCEYVIMEATSQGLEQRRLSGITFELAAFTNLTQDHLDVHGTMENYYQAKKMLFSMCKTALINLDDEGGARLYSEITCPKYGFSIEKEADFYADAIKLMPHGSVYWYCRGQKAYKTEIKLPGGYNTSNTLCALAAIELLGYDPNCFVPMIKDVDGVRGRCEVVPTGRDFTVILDYAHTPDALENILSSVKECAEGRVVCLFGCGGDRDPIKRPIMARAAAKHADFLIVTSDNPRNEDPHAIITEIISGLTDVQTEYIEIDDRREAIFWAMKNAQPRDTIVLAGKGHEDYQILKGGVKIHFDEREVVAEALESLK